MAFCVFNKLQVFHFTLKFYQFWSFFVVAFLNFLLFNYKSIVKDRLQCSVCLHGRVWIGRDHKYGIKFGLEGTTVWPSLMQAFYMKAVSMHHLQQAFFPPKPHISLGFLSFNGNVGVSSRCVLNQCEWKMNDHVRVVESPEG